MVIIYGNNDCYWCHMAKGLSEKYDLRYEWRDLALDEYKKEFKARFPEARTIPQIIWNDEWVGGYDDFAAAIENTIGGYGEGKI